VNGLILFSPEQFNEQLIQATEDIPVNITEIVSDMVFSIIQKFKAGAAPPGCMLSSIHPRYPSMGQDFKVLQPFKKGFVEEGI
jgi:hypothetical protein